MVQITGQFHGIVRDLRLQLVMGAFVKGADFLLPGNGTTLPFPTQGMELT